MNMNASIVKNYLKGKDVKFKWFFGHPKDKKFQDRLTLSLRVLSVIKSLNHSRLALVGGIAPGYYDLYFDERILQNTYGVTIFRHEIDEVLNRTVQYKSKNVVELVQQIKKEGKNINVNSEAFEKTARIYLALKDLAENNDYHALAVSCWPKIRKEYNLSVCSCLGRLNQNNIVAACEGDLPGALSMLILNYLSRNKSVLTDLVNFDTMDNSFLMWHCGPAAQCWADGQGMKYRRHGSAKSGVINDMVFSPGPVTIMRVTGEGNRIFFVTANVLNKNKQSYAGSRGWLENLKIDGKNVSILDLIETVILHGVQHHFAIGRENLNDEIMELIYWLGLQGLPLVRHKRYGQRAPF